MIDKEKKTKLPLTVVPEAWAILYVHPMIGKYKKSGRKCSNCFMWAANEQKCVIHSNDITIPGDAVCGYHVSGKPLKNLKDFVNHKSIQHVESELSGLGTNIPKEGTMCGNCKFYSPTKNKKGHCNVVVKDNDNLPLLKQPVNFYGCCSRWEEKTQK